MGGLILIGESCPTPKAQLRNGFRSCSFAMSVQVGPAPLNPTLGDGRDRGIWTAQMVTKSRELAAELREDAR